MVRGERFQWEEVAGWMKSRDIELMGAAYQALAAARGVVDGTVDWQYVELFFVDYLVLCLSDSEGRSAHRIFGQLPYLAAHDLAKFYCGLRLQGVLPSHPALERAREALKRLYVEGDSDQKACVVNGVLEHVFEAPECRLDFESWAADPTTAEAVKAATDWADTQHPPQTPQQPTDSKPP